jgi:hypothetical protein
VIASTAAAEESSCKILGSADGILQKFDIARYQACGLYANSQKAYSDGFIVGCTQAGNTQLICQAFVESSILNTKAQSAQTATQQLPTHEAAQQPQGIQPAAISK